ncbi:MAG TPA: DNA polymerase IV, partial [Polyangiaceae bacterium]|nr:DNA polymerase IV [Polyangiaceae bacterium]
MTSPARWVLHADMDAFYASIEQRDNPELRGIPVIVGAGSARGVVAAASYEARQFGVRSAMPGFRARKLCPQGVFLPANIQHYSAVSTQIHRVFEEFTPVIEPIALDEAFLDISGSMRLFKSPEILARQLKARVKEETELVVSVGVAPNKLVAKIACTMGKPDGLRIVQQAEIRALLDPLPIRRLWGVGPVLERTLLELGIERFSDLAQYNSNKLRAALGDRAAELQALARGEDDREVEAARAPKSYGEENTFDRDVIERDIVSATLVSHAEAIGQRLRRDGYAGRTVTLKMKLGKARGTRIARGKNEGDEPRYPLLSRSKTLPEPTSDAHLIQSIALNLWDKEALQEPVRLLGISVSNLSAREGEQLDLFDDRRRGERLGPA